jgi:ABC-type antimicrobial peptide transport system permease subunit
MDSSLPIPRISTMREIVSASVAQRRFQMALTSLFAFVALLPGAVGVYGVVSYSVGLPDSGYRTSDRTRSDEERRDALGLCERYAARMDRATRRIGWGYRDCNRAARPLFGITPTDPFSLGGVALILLFTSGMACYLPARRAARLDPMMALRHK